MATYIETLSERAAKAALSLGGYTSEDKNAILREIAAALLENESEILKQNVIDVAEVKGKDEVFTDRLTLNPKRVEAMVEGINQIIALPDPVGEVTERRTRPNGLEITKVRAPLGVVAIIYEARPNVTVDAAALCIKSGNAVILRGGKGAINSNRAIYKTIDAAVRRAGFDGDIVQFVDDISRESSKELLKQEKYIDVIIPRGGEELKRFILENSDIPVIASAGGNCHVYVEKSADLDTALKVVVNSKCDRPSVCNAAEKLLVDKEIATEFLPRCLSVLAEQGVEILGDSQTAAIYPCKEASEQDYYTEFHDMIIAVKVVDGIEDAVARINKYGTKHSEAILTTDKNAAKMFTAKVDAAAVYVNASTRFTDGFEFGLGAEMGISTGKLHARGPLGLKELTSEKYVVYGNGQIRNG